jgi:hypothetical protein
MLKHIRSALYFYYFKGNWCNGKVIFSGQRSSDFPSGRFGRSFLGYRFSSVVNGAFIYFEGGVKTIVITDTLQTSFMIISLIACIVYILSHLNLSLGEAYTILEQKNYTHFINFDPNSKTFFLKTILGEFSLRLQ